MKNVFLLFAVISMASINNLSAQITIEKGDFTPIMFEDTAIIASQYGFELPSTGNDQQWDYSFLQSSGFAFYREHYDGKEDDKYDTDFNYYLHTLSFQAFDFPGQTHYGYDENGFYELAQYNAEAAFSITTVTGGPNDQLVFDENNQVFEDRLDIVKFPMTMGDKWSVSRNERTPFRLTVAGFGLSNTPGESKRVTTMTREVVGHGTLVVPMTNDQTSGMMEVLLVKSVEEVVDSFFLAGSEAPQALMTAFGLVQGSKQTSETYEFYRRGYGYKLVEVTAANGLVDEITFSLTGPRGVSTSVRNTELLNSSSIYPNPTTPGALVNIKSNERLVSVSLFDISGKEIQGTTLIGEQNGAYSIALPESLKSGIYYYKALTENNMLKQGKLNVTTN